MPFCRSDIVLSHKLKFSTLGLGNNGDIWSNGVGVRVHRHTRTICAIKLKNMFRIIPLELDISKTLDTPKRVFIHNLYADLVDLRPKKRWRIFYIIILLLYLRLIAAASIKTTIFFYLFNFFSIFKNNSEDFLLRFFTLLQPISVMWDKCGF